MFDFDARRLLPYRWTHRLRPFGTTTVMALASCVVLFDLLVVRLGASPGAFGFVMLPYAALVGQCVGAADLRKTRLIRRLPFSWQESYRAGRSMVLCFLLVPILWLLRAGIESVSWVLLVLMVIGVGLIIHAVPFGLWSLVTLGTGDLVLFILLFGWLQWFVGSPLVQVDEVSSWAVDLFALLAGVGILGLTSWRARAFYRLAAEEPARTWDGRWFLMIAGGGLLALSVNTEEGWVPVPLWSLPVFLAGIVVAWSVESWRTLRRGSGLTVLREREPGGLLDGCAGSLFTLLLVGLLTAWEIGPELPRWIGEVRQAPPGDRAISRLWALWCLACWGGLVFWCYGLVRRWQRQLPLLGRLPASDAEIWRRRVVVPSLRAAFVAGAIFCGVAWVLTTLTNTLAWHPAIPGALCLLSGILAMRCRDTAPRIRQLEGASS